MAKTSFIFKKMNDFITNLYSDVKERIAKKSTNCRDSLNVEFNTMFST